jgi:hypothetical protein
MSWNKEECEAAAIAGYNRALGTILEVRRLDVFSSGEIRSIAVGNDVAVRVVITPNELLLQWEGDYLDARWCVEPVTTLPDINASAYWVYAETSWQIGVGPT